MNAPNGYTVSEVLYAGPRTSVARAVRDADGLPVILKTHTALSPSAHDLARYRYAFS